MIKMAGFISADGRKALEWLFWAVRDKKIASNEATLSSGR
jgi:hypothetical protein